MLAAVALGVAGAVLLGPRPVRATPAAVDLGTLGGPQSSALGISDSGEIVGEADQVDSSGNPIQQGAVWTPPSSAVGPYAATAFGGVNASGKAVNLRGQIAGMGYDQMATHHAMVWSPDGHGGYSQSVLDVGLGTIAIQSEAEGIDAGGRVVGEYQQTAPGGHSQAALWAPSVGGTYRTTDLPSVSPGIAPSHAWGLNDAGLIVGDVQGLNDAAILWRPDPLVPGRYTAVSLPDPSPLPPPFYSPTGSTAEAINDSGVVVGTAFYGFPHERAVVWNPQSDGTYIPMDLGTLGGQDAGALALNNRGVAVGWSVPAGGSTPHAALWTPPTTPGGAYTVTDLGTLGGPRSIAVAINAEGEVVGSADVTAGVSRASLWFPAAAAPTIRAGDASAVHLEGVTLLGGTAAAYHPPDGGQGMCEAGPVSTTGASSVQGAGVGCGGSVAPVAGVTAGGTQESVETTTSGCAGICAHAEAESLRLLPGMGPGHTDVLDADGLEAASSMSCGSAMAGWSSLGRLTVAGQRVATQPVGSRIVFNPTGRNAVTVYGNPISVNPTGAAIPMAIVTLNYRRQTLDPVTGAAILASAAEVEFPARGPLRSLIVGRVYLSYTEAEVRWCPRG